MRLPFICTRRRRVPVVLQMGPVECGAASLVMILRYFGLPITVAECARLLGSGRDGVNCLSLVQCARRLGLEVKAFSVPVADLSHVSLPAIAHWDTSHFVVIEDYSGRQVRIVDPAIGRRVLDIEEFAESFSGIVLTFQVGLRRPVEERSRPIGLLAHLRTLVQTARVRGLLASIIGASVALQMVALALPWLTRFLIDRVLAIRAGDMLGVVGLAGIAAVACHACLSFVRALLSVRLEARLDGEMMPGFLKHVLSAPFSFFEQRASGDLLMRLSSTNTIRDVLASQAIAALLDGAMVLVTLPILVYAAPSLGLLAIAFAGLQITLTVATAPWQHRLTQRSILASASSQSYLVEALSGISNLKAAGREQRALDHWSSLFAKLQQAQLSRNRATAIIANGVSAAQMLSGFGFLWIGAGLVLRDGMSLGSLLAVNAIAVACFMPIANLVASAQRFQLAAAHWERLVDVLEQPPEQDRSAVTPAPALTGRIEVREVSFRHTANGVRVLDKISVSIRPGMKIGIVGRTGSGKTTLGRILLGLYTPSSGEVFYDGIPLRELEYGSVRRQIGAVLQEPALFGGTIRDNIAFHDPTMPLDEVIAAAQLAGIHDEIMVMPMRYQTQVGEAGSGLSGGQRQRIAIARAVARRPSILFFDEATSHLDAVSERELEERLGRLSSVRIVIAHRLSTIRDADLILVMESGSIVERGTHDQLLATGGVYAGLIHNQTATMQLQAT